MIHFCALQLYSSVIKSQPTKLSIWHIKKIHAINSRLDSYMYFNFSITNACNLFKWYIFHCLGFFFKFLKILWFHLFSLNFPRRWNFMISWDRAIARKLVQGIPFLLILHQVCSGFWARLHIYTWTKIDCETLSNHVILRASFSFTHARMQ